MDSNNTKKLDLLKDISSFLLICYIYGFIAWNYLLSKFSFFEYNLLQTRYLSAGLLFVIFSSLVALLLVGLLFILSKILSFNLKKISISFAWVVFFLFILIPIDIYIFSPLVFVRMPQYLGGAHPSVISFIGTSDQIDYLSNFNIPKAANGEDKVSVQTNILCKLYQNENYIIVGVVDEEKLPRRVLIIDRNQVMGISVITENKHNNSECIKFWTDY